MRRAGYNGNQMDIVKEQRSDDYQRKRLFHAVNATARILLAAMEEETFEASVLEGMSIIAHCLDFDRGYIWQNEVKDGALHYAMHFEWQNDTGRKLNPVNNKAIYPYTDIPGWEKKFLQGECVNGTLDDLSITEQERLKPHGMKSVFAVPVFMNDTFWGWVSFDDCIQERVLTDEEISTLRSVCLMIGNAIIRNEQTEKNRYEHTLRNRLLNTVNNAASILLQAEVDEFENALLRCMGMLGEALQVDRVYVWRNFTEDDGRLYCTQLYEWSEGAEPQQDNKYTNNVSYDDNMPGWEDVLSAGKCINGIVSEMNSHAQAQLSPQDILSILVVPVFLREQFWGFVGFDDCHNERVFTDSDETILRSGSLLIGHAMLRNDLTLSLRTAAKELESAYKEAKAASRAKSDFLSNMSHEMRTPMNAIIGMTQIGKSASNIEKKDYAFEKIEGASNHLLDVINDVLDMSKIEARNFDLFAVEFDFKAMLRKAVNITDFRIEEKKQQLKLYFDSAIPKYLYGDEQRIMQVIINLLSNAVKFTPERGSIWLNANFENEADGICTIKVEVKDTGIGIDPEHHARVFSSFEQAENSASRKFGGTGIGLAVCKHIVELMNGKIWIESELGKGAAFIFTVQFKRCEKLSDETIETLQVLDNEIENINTFPGCRILLAEDVEINREIVISLLEPVEVEIDCALNGAEAVKMFTAEPDRYDMIFMDMQMPQMDGLEAARKIRSLDINKAKNIPIVAMTANVFKGDIEKCLEAGMNAHIGKPLDLSEVMKVLNKYLVK